MTTTTRELKQLRADMDVLISMAKDLRNSRETSSALTRLEEGKMHIGNTLYELDEAKIYKESTNASNNTIDPYHVDDVTPMNIPADWNQGTLIQNVKIMRREIDLIITRIKSLICLFDCSDRPFSHFFLHEALGRTRESMNWMGMELGRLRDTQI